MAAVTVWDSHPQSGAARRVPYSRLCLGSHADTWARGVGSGIGSGSRSVYVRGAGSGIGTRGLGRNGIWVDGWITGLDWSLVDDLGCRFARTVGG